MTSQVYCEETVCSFAYIQVAKTSDDSYLWENKYEVDNKHYNKLFNIVKTSLTGELSKNHKDYISYNIVSVLDGEDMLIESSLIIRYMPESDFDVLSIVDEARRIVKSAFSSVEKVMNITDSQVHRAKIILANQINESNTKSEHVVVASELEKSLIEKIITGVSVKACDEVICKVNIDDEEICMTLPKIDNSSIISEKSKFEVVSIICVDDKRMKVKVLNEHEYKQKEFYFDEDLRNDLLESQLHRTVLEIEIVPNEKLNFGEWIENGGSIVAMKKIDDNKLI